ncbi:hypothetical protein HPB49_025237 [Dermacentor silvarum]|uniref:Uncharacterized protein n=1 Tax=Dermacentor silvarum TaxID=543639 RepID=A0ACB8E474_DERSI|nr:hypothetical protein HPB49_025237 [Dermacentor silvarum]
MRVSEARPIFQGGSARSARSVDTLEERCHPDPQGDRNRKAARDTAPNAGPIPVPPPLYTGATSAGATVASAVFDGASRRCRCDKAECTRLRRSAYDQRAFGAHSVVRGHPPGRRRRDPESSRCSCVRPAAARGDNGDPEEKGAIVLALAVGAGAACGSTDKRPTRGTAFLSMANLLGRPHARGGWRFLGDEAVEPVGALAAMATHGGPPVFDEKVDNWEAYLLRLESYFEVHNVIDEKKRRALSVTALSTRTVDLLAARYAPAKIQDLKYDDAMKVLGESANEFIVEVRKIANGCNFGDALDRMLRDRLIYGLRDANVRRKLLTKDNAH